jgi:serine/threonine protein kinase
MESLIGKTLGQYQLVDQIGKGGMATVYKAYQPGLDRYVAVKILPAYFQHEPGFAARFTREAKAIAQLDHPNILPVYDFGKQDNISYIVMKYVSAGTLHDRLGAPISPAEIITLTEQIAAALDHAHQQGILHRDIKPSNILLDDRSWVYLSDFGLAKMVEGSVALTGSGVGVGTPTYMSPEQGQGLEVDARTDVYSLGVILFEMFTGSVPYEAETPMAVVIKHVTDPIPIPRHINPDIPPAVERVLLKALSKDRAGRFNAAGQLAAALKQAVQQLPSHTIADPIPHIPVAAPPRTPPPPPISTSPVMPMPLPPARSFPWLPVLVGAGALIAIAVCGLIGLFFVMNNPPAGSGDVSPQAIIISPTPSQIIAPTTAAVTVVVSAPSPTSTPQPTSTPTPASSGDSLTTSSASPTPTSTPVPIDTPTDTPTATASPTPTITPTPPRWTDTGLRPTGAYKDIWDRLGGSAGSLGYPLANPVEDRLCARQNFERGYMLWVDSPQDPDPVWAAIFVSATRNLGSKSYKFTDTWPGEPEYWCTEAEKNAPLGPKRGFGMLWCIYPNLRADVGQALDKEVGGPDYPGCSFQLFQGGAIAHTPFDSSYWAFIDNGDWYRSDD